MCRGRVLLHLEELILVDRCQVMVLQPQLCKYVWSLETSSFLLQECQGVKTTEPLEKLLEMARRIGIEIKTPVSLDSSSMSLDEETATQINKRSAHLEMGETSAVYMSECFSPDNFYLTIVNNETSLECLERELLMMVEKGGIMFYTAKKGDFVICYFEEDKVMMCRRGQILDIKSTQIDENTRELNLHQEFSVFLLDSGIVRNFSVNEIFKCEEDLMTKIPFQAIHCRLGHVKPAGDNWSKDSGDKLFELTRGDDDDEALVIECNVLSRDVSNVYTVELRCGVNFAEHLVEHECAEWTDQSSTLSLPNNQDIHDDCDYDPDDGLDDDSDDVLEAPNGVDTQILDMELLKTLTEEQMDSYWEENIDLDMRAAQCVSDEKNDHDMPAQPLHSVVIQKLPLDLSLLDHHDSDLKMKLPWISWRQCEDSVSIRCNIFAQTELTQDQVHYYQLPPNKIFEFLSVRKH